MDIHLYFNRNSVSFYVSIQIFDVIIWKFQQTLKILMLELNLINLHEKYPGCLLQCLETKSVNRFHKSV